MKTTDLGHWQRTSPFAALFFFGKLLKLIAQNAWQSLAPLGAFVVAYQGDLVSKIVIGVIAFAVFAVGYSLLNYWFFRFQLNEDSILIRQGVIKKSQLDIKFDRIQGINTQQNIVFRYLGLVTVSFDTAGSTGNEGNLPAVTRDFASSLRDFIGTLRKTADMEETVAPPATQPLLSLDWRDVVRIGLADRRALIVFAALSPLLERIDDNLYRLAADYVDDALAGNLLGNVPTAAVIAVGVVVTALVALASISIAAAFLRYHEFELYLDGDTLRSHGGLLTRHEVAMNLGKIQTLRLEQGVIMHWFGRYQMSGRQARSSQQQDKSKNFSIPIVSAAQANHLRELLMAPEGDELLQIPTSPAFNPVSPHYMRTRFLLISLLPTAAGLAFFVPLFGLAGGVVLFWTLVSGLFIYQSWRRAGYRCAREGLVRRSGVVGYRTVALLHRKVQRVTVRQSPYQRRKGLATLRVYMASGSVRIPYIEHDLAQRLRDYILYKVESSRQAWH